MPEQFRLNCSISMDQNVPHPNDVVPRNLSVLSSSSDRSLVKAIMLSAAWIMSSNRPESRSGSLIDQDFIAVDALLGKGFYRAVCDQVHFPFQ